MQNLARALDKAPEAGNIDNGAAPQIVEHMTIYRHPSEA